MDINFQDLKNKVKNTETIYSEGIVNKVIGLTIEVQGIKAFVGELCIIYNQQGNKVNCEVVGFKDDNVILMPLGHLTGIAPGCKVVPQNKPLSVNCSDKSTPDISKYPCSTSPYAPLLPLGVPTASISIACPELPDAE